MNGLLLIEINGTLLPASTGIEGTGSGKKLTVRGSSAELNLRSGPNRVRLITDGKRSNLLVVTF